MDESKSIIPFEDVGDQKFYTGSTYNLSIFGLPDSYSGVTKRNQLAYTKKGVALAYMLIPALKACVDIISTNLATVPMVLKDSKGNIVHRTDTSGSAQNDFLAAIERSYKYYGVPLMELWAKSILLYGECVIEKVPTLYDKKYVGLKWLNSVAISIELKIGQDESATVFLGGENRYDEVRIFHYSGRMNSVTYTEDEVLYSRSFNPIDDIRGYSDALAALGNANITIEFENFVLSFYANNGHPGVIISPKDRLAGDKQVKEWQRQWQEEFRGSGNQFKTHISGFPFDVQTFDILDISKPLEVSKNAESKILKTFRVSPENLGDTSENGYQFSKETKNAFMQTVVRPLALSISNCINHSGIIKEFGSTEDDLKFGFDFSEYENVAKSDIDKQDVQERRVKSGGISIGQYQRSIGSEVVQGSDDVYMIPQGFVVVKKDAITNPELIPNPNDQRGPDASSLNQSDRETQSVTGDEDTVEFFGSKSIDEDVKFNQNALNLDKYSKIDVNIPEDVKNALNNPFYLNLITPKNYIVDNQLNLTEIKEFIRDIENVKNKYDEAANKSTDVDNGIQIISNWLTEINSQMVKEDKKEFSKSLTISQIQQMANESGLDIDTAMKMLKEFEEYGDS